MQNRLITLWERTTKAERSEGASWYPEAHRFADYLAFWTNRPIEQTCGVIAALSPQLSWERNCEAAEAFIKHEPIPGVLQASIRRAGRILRGAAPSATAFPLRSCPKTNSFYHNLLDPDDPRYVTIDRHAASAGLGRSAKRFDYWQIEAAYREAAQAVGVLPSAFQATLWLCQRKGWQGSLDS